MNGFPTEFPTQAAQVFVQAVLNKETRDVGRMALAGYDMLGFGLFKYFGDVKYLMQDPAEMQAIMASAPPEIMATFSMFETLDAEKPIPDWAVPLIMQAVTWLLTTLMARLNRPKPVPLPA